MLVLSRRQGERIHIGDGVVVTLVSIDGKRARVGIEAPPEIKVLRHELHDHEKTDESLPALCLRHPR